MSAEVGLTEAEREALAEALGGCQFQENPNDGSMCLCGLPALNHDATAIRVVLGDHPRAEHAVARIKEQAKAEALREAACKWQWGEWTVITAKINKAEGVARVIGTAQAVTDWLRARAADAEAGR